MPLQSWSLQACFWRCHLAAKMCLNWNLILQRYSKWDKYCHQSICQCYPDRSHLISIGSLMQLSRSSGLHRTTIQKFKQRRILSRSTILVVFLRCHHCQHGPFHFQTILHTNLIDPRHSRIESVRAYDHDRGCDIFLIRWHCRRFNFEIFR